MTLAQYDKRVANLGSPLVQQYVRHLQLWPYAYRARSNRDTIDGVSKRWPTPYTAERGVRTYKTLKAMTRVTALEVGLNRYHLYVPDFLPAVVAGWASMRTTLVTLTMDIPAEAWHRAVPSTAVFPVLEGLHLILWWVYQSTDGEAIMRDIVAPFISNQHCSLTQLSLRTPRTAYQYILVHPSLSIRLLPRLESLTIEQIITSANTQHLRRLLDLHSPSITHLDLRILSPESRYSLIPSIDEWYTQPALQARLPHLKSLALSLPSTFMASAPHIGEYLKPYAPTLTALELRGFFVPWHHVADFLRAFACNHPLETLTLCVECLNPQLLGLLRDRFPRLRRFSPAYHDIDHAPALSFEEGLRTHGVRGWGLRHLEGVMQPWGICDGAEEFTLALKEALPDLQTLSLFWPYYGSYKAIGPFGRNFMIH
ncbi:hypothetical protein DXG01_003403 [Tephrocybe rancida]|nr:hypothetical protein DXG01_003403 [Tephrocybe rancida]